MNSSLFLPHLLASQKLRLPKSNFPGTAREKRKVASLIGASTKSCKEDDSDAEEDEVDIDHHAENDEANDSSDSSLPEDWLDRFAISSHRPPWMSKSTSSSSGDERSSDDWSTASAELSDETRSGRTAEDSRAIPVFLGPLEDSGFVDVSGGDGGVLKRVYQAGESGNCAFDRYVVDLKYVVYLPSLRVVDVSKNDMWENKEHRFTLGSGEVMRGMEIVAKSMERKEKARFRIRSDYAFGEEGSPPKIPPKTEWLIVDVEMMGLRPPIRDKMFLRSNEVLPYVLGRKEKGNAFFKRGEMMKAVHEYKSCLKAISYVDDSNYLSALEGPRLLLLGNLAAAHLALKNWKRTIKYCSMVLEKDVANEKALFRRFQALKQFPDRLEDARKDLTDAIKINPKSKQFRDEYAALLEEIKQKRKADAKAYGTIFKKDAAIYQSENVRCFFDIGIGKRVIGRIEMELFCSKVPKTCENFRALCCGEHAGLTYQKTVFHRVIEGFIVQGGDVTMQKGAGGKSIYGDTFEDENFSVDCGRAGVLCMANAGVPNSNQSQFFITLAPCPQLQGQCVAFGRVVAGSAVLKTIAALDVDESDAPTEPVTIVKCGQVKGKDRMVDSSSEDE